MQIKNENTHINQPLSQPPPNQKQNTHFSLQAFVQSKLNLIFRGFRFESISFYLMMINCVVWVSVNIVELNTKADWDCVQLWFFAKFQPDIVYDGQVWRLLLSSFMFRSWIQFYFNNFGLLMLAPAFQRESKLKFLLVFYGGILAGHMLSCCFAPTSQITVGISCGTIGLLPLELKRFLKLRKSNPLQAGSRSRFLIFNLGSNLILNVLAIFKLDAVDWVSHIGCLISGALFLCFYHCKQNQSVQQHNEKQKKVYKIYKYLSLITLIIFYLIMGLYMWLVQDDKTEAILQMQKMNFVCSKFQ